MPETRRVTAGRSLLAGLLIAASLDVAAASLTKWTGGRLPAFKLADADGKEQGTADWRGKTVVVNFWATWCEPCREEMPSLDRLRKRLGSQPFEVIAVNVGEAPERVARFTRDVPVSFPILYDKDSSTAKRWKVRGYPTSYVVGPDGRIRYYFVGELDWAHDDIVRVIESIR